MLMVQGLNVWLHLSSGVVGSDLVFAKRIVGLRPMLMHGGAEHHDDGLIWSGGRNTT